MRIETVIPITGLPADYQQSLSNMGFEVGGITNDPPGEPLNRLKQEYIGPVVIDGFLACSDEEKKTFYESAPEGTGYPRTPSTFVQVTLPENWSSIWDLWTVERGGAVSSEVPVQFIHALRDENNIVRLRCDYALLNDRSVELKEPKFGGSRNPFYALPYISVRYTFSTWVTDYANLGDKAIVSDDPRVNKDVASLHTYNSRIPLEQKQELAENYKNTAIEIIRRNLPHIDNPLAYWGRDTSQAIAQINREFSVIEKQFYNDYAARPDAKPRFDFENFGYALFFDDAEWRGRRRQTRIDAPEGYQQNQNPEVFKRIEDNCRAIVRELLPDVDKPFAYWGKDCADTLDMIELRLKEYDMLLRENHRKAEKGEIATFSPERRMLLGNRKILPEAIIG